MNQQEAEKLIEKYLQGTATIAERHLVENWYASVSERQTLSKEEDFEYLAQELWEATLKRADLPTRQKSVRLWPRVAVAASILLILSFGGYLTLKKQPVKQQVVQNKPQKGDILPGGNKAVLTLANGKQIILTDKKNGQIAKEHNTLIDKTADGQVVYHSNDKNNTITYNTMVTPRGGQYTLILADGTSVTLNAASSIKFPVTFNGDSRTVELRGEAYFEVVHDPSRPFRVISNGQTVEVLGTHFNINSYEDEDVIRTTLLEGRVKINTGNETAFLKPGQQSQIVFNAKHPDISIAAVDLEEAVAWKNGLFEFKNASIKEVMKSAARWYDIDVAYPGKIPDIRITGRISRNVNFSGLIGLLEFEGVKFNMEGKRVNIIN